MTRDDRPDTPRRARAPSDQRAALGRPVPPGDQGAARGRPVSPSDQGAARGRPVSPSDQGAARGRPVSPSDQGAARGRLLAIDFGERRIGLAVSDPTGTIASPAGFVARRAGKRVPVAELVRRAEEVEAVGFVLGLPLDDEGRETSRTAEVRALAAELEKRTGHPARLVDERYSTAAALRAIREMGGSTRGRKGDVDALAATFLLQHALALPR